jgi:PKD repeat protein
MKQLFLLILSGTYFFSSSVYPQCPSVLISAPDSICSGTLATFQNSTTGASFHAWDFCPGDLDTVPSGSNIGNTGGLSLPNQVKLIEDNGNYYAFIANLLGNNIIRVDFGTSLDNPAPATFIYPGFAFPTGIDVIKEGNNWIALVVNYTNQRLYRLDLGTSIAANVGNITDLGQFGFNNPRNVKIAYDNGNYFAFVTNDAGNSINKISFGNSMTNTPTGSTLTDPSFSFTWGFDVVYDCAAGKFLGYAANYNSGQISVIDFGSTLANTGTVVHTLSPSAGNIATLKLAFDSNGWNLLTLSNSNSTLTQLKLGFNLLNQSPAQGYAGAAGSINSPRGIDMMKVNSEWYAVISNAGSNSLSVLKFVKTCAASVSVSNAAVPPPVEFFNEGWNHILYQAFDASGTFNAVVDSIYVLPLPSAAFAPGNTCLNSPVLFTDQSFISNGIINQWIWDFGDGSPVSTVQNPQHIYTSAGTVTVQLIVVSQAGCSDTASQTLNIHELPVSSFVFSNNQCRGQAVPFTDTSSPPLNDVITGWEWNFGDGSPVSLLSNPTHIFDSAGTFQVQLIVFTNNGCSDTSSQFITIVPGPKAEFEFSGTCVGQATAFNNQTTIQGGGTLTYQWSFGDGGSSTDENPVYQYPLQAANYVVQLVATSQNGCTDTLQKDIRISNKANPSFSVSPAVSCINSNIQFTSTSTVNQGDSIIAISWNFGDSPLVFTGNPVIHQYNNPGTYTVTLTVKTYSDCDTTFTANVTVIESPVANFTFQNVCLDSAMTFINQSSTPAGTTIDSILWDFGDGNTASGAVVNHTYQSAGAYTVTLTVINSAGCTNTTQKQVTVHPRPLASWVNSFPCSQSTISFFNTSSIPSGSIAAYQWNFGDNSTSALASPQHIYQSAGTYQVQLIAFSQFGCTDTTTEPLTVYQSPEFDFSYTQTCHGKPTQFTYINLLPGQPDTASFWNWNFGDGTPVSILPSPSHLFAQPGNYNVTLIATAFNTCSKTVVRQVSINPVPVADFSTSNFICMGTPSVFTNQSTIASGTISQYIWNFGDGSPLSFAVNPVHTYDSTGSFIAKLVAISDSGCVDSTMKQISVAPLPVISFSPTPDYGSPPLTVSVQNTTPGSNTYLWNFGDGSPLQTGPNPVHVYNDTGTFIITVIVTNSSGCSDSLSKTVEVVIPFSDLAITQVSAAIQNNLLQMYAQISNQGNVIAGKFEIRSNAGNGSMIYEEHVPVPPLKPGENILVPLKSRPLLQTGFEPEFYCIEIVSVNGAADDVLSNNRQCGSLNDNFGQISVFPVPVSGTLTAAFNVPSDGTAGICIYDMAGKKIKCYEPIAVAKGHNQISIPVKDISQGSYSCVIKFGDLRSTVKFVKTF